MRGNCTNLESANCRFFNVSRAYRNTVDWTRFNRRVTIKMKLIFFSHANRIKRVGKLGGCDDREWKISPRRGDGNASLHIYTLWNYIEWKISPRRGDGNLPYQRVHSVHREWKISPRRGDGNIYPPYFMYFFIMRMEDKSPKRGRKPLFSSFVYLFPISNGR